MDVITKAEACAMAHEIDERGLAAVAEEMRRWVEDYEIVPSDQGEDSGLYVKFKRDVPEAAQRRVSVFMSLMISWAEWEDEAEVPVMM